MGVAFAGAAEHSSSVEFKIVH